MKIEINDNFFYDLKRCLMVEFLKDDLDMLSSNVWVHPDDIKENKKLVKAYKRILDYYGENHDATSNL
jgi:hypothetical protein